MKCPQEDHIDVDIKNIVSSGAPDGKPPFLHEVEFPEGPLQADAAIDLLVSATRLSRDEILAKIPELGQPGNFKIEWMKVDSEGLGGIDAVVAGLNAIVLGEYVIVCVDAHGSGNQSYWVDTTICDSQGFKKSNGARQDLLRNRGCRVAIPFGGKF